MKSQMMAMNWRECLRLALNALKSSQLTKTWGISLVKLASFSTLTIQRLKLTKPQHPNESLPYLIDHLNKLSYLSSRLKPIHPLIRSVSETIYLSSCLLSLNRLFQNLYIYAFIMQLLLCWQYPQDTWVNSTLTKFPDLLTPCVAIYG